MLCDGCPRSFHLACLGLGFQDLPEGSWECPKCGERKDASLRRLLDSELHKADALDEYALKAFSNQDPAVCAWF